MIRVGIVGATGYTGLECIRLLLQHPYVSIDYLFTSKQFSDFPDYLANKKSLPDCLTYFDPKSVPELDCLFLAVPHGTVHSIMKDLETSSCKIVDLSADFRLHSADLFEQYYNQVHDYPELLNKVPYGLPELYTASIKQANIVANPGCYATASILALYPLKDRIVSAIVDAKSGVTGAGKKVSELTHYCEVNDHVSSYSTNVHRHQVELREHCHDRIVFSPHLVPMSRGIICSCYITTNKELTYDDVVGLYENAYKNASFVRVHKTGHKVTTQDSVGSNMCDITISSVTKDLIIVFSTIDNLIKGAAGQAIQNMNIMFDLDETLGLPMCETRI